MRRRDFLKLGGPSLMIPSLINDSKAFEDESLTGSIIAKQDANAETLDRLGGVSLGELLDFHKNYLIETYIPNIRRGIDWKRGGFADATIPGKEPSFDKKSMYYQARAVWLFSYIYNHITYDKQDLDAAIQGRNFLVKHALTDDAKWASFLSRKGERQSESLDHYGDIYMVLGLAEFYKATKDDKDLELAIATAHSVMNRLLSPVYQHVDAHGPTMEPGTRRLPSWQHFLNSLTALLKVKRDPAIEKIARYCVRAICQKHWQPKDGVLLEVLDDHFHPYTFDSPEWGEGENRNISGWHSIQACWTTMDEAIRVKDYSTFRRGLEMGYATFAKCYVEKKGFVPLENPGAKPDLNKPIHPPRALTDALVFCLMSLEYIHDPKVVSYYNEIFSLYNSKPDELAAQDLLHTPRLSFRSIEILTRMIANNGKTSDLFG